jgi:hypothetical protein
MWRHAEEEPQRPPSPDGLTLGSPNIFAAVGTDPDDLSSLDVLWCDHRAVRPLAKLMTVGLRLRGRGLSPSDSQQPIPLAAFPDQTLRRIEHTSIAVSESSRADVKLTCVDFAPMGTEDNFLCRWFLAENTGSDTRNVDVVVSVTAPGEWQEVSGGVQRLGDKLAVLATAAVRLHAERLELKLGRLRPGERASAALLIVGASDANQLSQDIERAQKSLPTLLDALDETRAEWEAWCNIVPLKTGGRRLDDLLASLLCLVRSHVGPEAIHTGSLRYPHDRAWVRDSYWVQRALLELGRAEEARLNLDFFHRAWRESGIASYYEIASRSSSAYGYHGVELPHYLVLMVRDAEEMAAADGAAYWDMVSGCLDAAAVPGSALQPMNGDETWLLAAPVRELDFLLSNSWLLVASAEYGADLAARMDDYDRAARYQSLAARARVALDRFLPRVGEAEWFAIGYGGDGTLDFSLCPGVLARGALLGVLPSTDPHLAAGLMTSWHRLSFDRGLRTHPRSATFSGATPGYVLRAAADWPGCTFLPELADRMMDLASATGCVWEFHDLYDPAWGGEKRRLWDSSVVLMGLVRAFFEREEAEGGVEFVPKAVKKGESDTGPPTAPFDAEQLFSGAGDSLLLQERSREHAHRIARELLRQCNRAFAVSDYGGKPPAEESAIIVSRNQPPPGWKRVMRGYWVRDWPGPPQVWVRNAGHVFLDTGPFLTDLFLLRPVEREKPAPLPDASFDVAARFGRLPGENGSDAPEFAPARLTVVSGSRAARGTLNLAGGKTTLAAGEAETTVTARPDREAGLLRLSASSPGPRPKPVELSVTLPPGWWLVYARDMTGGWDRVRDPVAQIWLPDGRIQLNYVFGQGEYAVNLTFDLACLSLEDGAGH